MRRQRSGGKHARGNRADQQQVGPRPRVASDTPFWLPGRAPVGSGLPVAMRAGPWPGIAGLRSTWVAAGAEQQRCGHRTPAIGSRSSPTRCRAQMGGSTRANVDLPTPLWAVNAMSGPPGGMTRAGVQNEHTGSAPARPRCRVRARLRFPGSLQRRTTNPDGSAAAHQSDRRRTGRCPDPTALLLGERHLYRDLAEFSSHRRARRHGAGVRHVGRIRSYGEFVAAGGRSSWRARQQETTTIASHFWSRLERNSSRSGGGEAARGPSEQRRRASSCVGEAQPPARSAVVHDQSLVRAGAELSWQPHSVAHKMLAPFTSSRYLPAYLRVAEDARTWARNCSEQARRAIGSGVAGRGRTAGFPRPLVSSWSVAAIRSTTRRMV